MSKELVIPSKFTIDDKFSSGFKKMTNSTKGQLGEMQGEMSKFGSFIKNNQESFRRMGRNATIAGGVIIGSLGLMAREAVNFESGMSNVATLIDTSKESISDMGDSVLNLSTQLPVPVEELTASLYDIRSAGIDASQQFDTLGSAAKLSVAGLSSVSEATNISTSALNAFAKENLTAAQTNDILFKTVKYGKTTIAEMASGFGAVTSSALSANVSLAQLSASTAALTSVGVPTAQSQTMLKALFSEMARDSGKLADAYKKQTKGNISLDTTGKGYYETLQKLYAATGENDTAFKNMFSSVEAGGAALSLITNASESYKNTLKDMQEGPEALGEAFEKQGDTAKSQMQLLKNNTQSLAITMGQALLPVLNDIMQDLTPMVQSFGAWAKANKPIVSGIVKLVAGLGATLAVLGPVLYMVGSIGKVMKSATVAISIAKVAMSAFGNSASAALGPVGLILAAVGTGIALYNSYANSTKKAATNEELATEVRKRALDATVEQRVEAMMLFDTMKKSKQGTDEYRNAVQRLEEMQPGIIQKYRDKNGLISDAIGLEKEYMNTIMERAMQEARADLVKEKYAESLRRGQEGPEFGDVLNSLFDQGVSGLFSNPLNPENMKTTMKGAMDYRDKDAARLMDEGDRLAAMNLSREEKSVSPEMTEQISNLTKSEVLLKIDNNGSIQNVNLTGGSNFAMNVIPAVGSTMK